MVINLYTCPDCGNMFGIGQSHQHEDGEWVTTDELEAFYRELRWKKKIETLARGLNIKGTCIEFSYAHGVLNLQMSLTKWFLGWLQASFKNADRIKIKKIRVVER